MSVSRVTSQTQWAALRSDMTSAARRTSEATELIASGRKVQKVSDAPTDAATVLRMDEQTAALDAYAKQAVDAGGWLATADTALQTVSNLFNESLGTLRASMNGALNPEAREALATQLEALSDHMYELASTTHLGQPIFGGFGTAAVTRDAAGTVSYAGVPGQVLRQVAPNTEVAVNVDGAAAFGFTGGDDAFQVLADASAAARSGNVADASAVLTRMQARHTDALTALHNVGTTVRRVESATSRGEAMKLSLAAARSDLVDVDIPKAVMDMQLAEDGYSAVLGAISRVSRMPSLAELLR